MQQRPAKPAGSQRPATVCVVENDRSVRRAMRRLLSSLGLGTLTFASVREVMQAPEHLEAACFVVDIHLGGEDGFSLMDRLEEEGHPAPIVLVTGHVDEALARRARSTRAVDLLIKPFDDETLVAALEKCQCWTGPRPDTPPL